MAVPERRWTAEDYLKFERASSEKHELVDGEIVQFAGASAKHNLITGNVLACLHAQLRGRDCVIYPADMRLRVRSTGLFTYPDLSVVCGSSQFVDERQDTLLNPTLLIEVLSPSTESYDRGQKFQHYRTIEGLQEYLLVSQHAARVERYVRQQEERWLLTDYVGLDAVIDLAAIACLLPMAEVYEKVNLSATE